MGEALALGLPVVAYDLPALRVAYKECQALFVLRLGDVKGLARKVLELLTNEKLYEKTSKLAIEYMKSYFTWEDVIRVELKAYHLIKKRK